MVYEKRTVSEWFNPETSRYEWNATTDAWDTLANVYTDDNTDDDSPAYAYSRERWTLTEQDETWHYYLREGFQGPYTVPLFWGRLSGWGLAGPIGWDGQTDYSPTAIAQPHFWIERAYEGCKCGTMTRSKRWYAVRTYVKSRTVTAYPFDFWEETEPANGLKVLGSKEAALNLEEQFIETEQSVTQLGTDGRGYQTDEEEYRAGFLALGGAPYWYGDDTERSDASEELRFSGATCTKYIGTGEQSHDEIVTETNWDNRTQSTVATTGLDSYLPAAERIPDSGPTTDTDVYADDAEQAALYQKAYRTESKPISVTVTDLDLENCSTRGVHKISAAYLESEDEAEWLARWIIDEARAGVLEGDLAGANFFISPGDWCASVRFLALGLNATAGRVEEVSWDWRAGSVLNTSVKILLYP